MWLNRQDALRKLAKAQQADLFEQKVFVLQGDTAHLRADVRTLSQRIIENQAILADMVKKGGADSVIMAALRDKIAADKEEKKAFEEHIKKDDKLIKQLRHKIFWTSVGGLVGIAATIFLFLKK